MSGHADTIRDWLISYGYKCITDEQGERHTIPQGNEESLSALDALVAELQQQADRIAWLEGDVAGWRIKLAAAEEETEQLRDALAQIDVSSPLPAHWGAAEWWKHIASQRREIARLALDGTPSAAQTLEDPQTTGEKAASSGS